MFVVTVKVTNRAGQTDLCFVPQEFLERPSSCADRAIGVQVFVEVLVHVVHERSDRHVKVAVDGADHVGEVGAGLVVLGGIQPEDRWKVIGDGAQVLVRKNLREPIPS